MSDPPASDDEMIPLATDRPGVKRWGYVEDGVFIPVPKGPLITADLGPPCVVSVRGAPRNIIEEPN